MTRMLASVRDAQEAGTVLNAAEIGVLDMKDPARGALGALAPGRIAEINAIAGGRCATSATIGDLPPEPGLIVAAINKTVALGVTYVKVGLFGAAYLEQCLAAVRETAAQTKLVGVLFADHFNHFAGPCRLLKAAGFHGAMIDTADKQAGGLLNMTDCETLRTFVTEARRLGMLCGLAGSLGAGDIEQLAALAPDYLGFRGALCAKGQRNAGIDAQAVADIARRMNDLREKREAVISPAPAQPKYPLPGNP